MEEFRGSYLSASIRVELEADGARYRLAPRKVGAIRHLGWIPVALGALLAGAVLTLAWNVAAPILERGVPGGRSTDSIASWIGLGALLLGGLLGLSIAYRMLRFGLFVVAGHSEVRLSAGQLIGIEHGGPLRRSRRARADRVRVLRVTEALPGPGGPPLGAGLPPVARLEAVPDSGPSLSLATAYPAEELEVLAHDLAERMPSASILSGGAAAPAPTVERVRRGVGGELPAPRPDEERSRGARSG